MGSNHQTAALPLQPTHIVERPHAFDRIIRKVQEQDVSALDRSLDSRNQDDPPFGRTSCQGTHIELPVVQRNRQRVVSERRRVVDQLAGRVRDPVDWIVRRVDVEIDLQHAGRGFMNHAGFVPSHVGGPMARRGHPGAVS